MTESLADSLALINDVLQAAIVIFGSAVVLYNTPYWRGDRVTRSFSNLIFFVVLVYFTELLVSRTLLPLSAEMMLRFGWLGITFVPGALFHLSDALLISTGFFSRRRRRAVRLLYLAALGFLAVVLFTDWIASGFRNVPRVPHLSAGPGFAVFVLFFLGVTGVSIANVVRARRRCVTRTTRQRMTTILAAFLAAPLAVFPYQLVANSSRVVLPIWILLIAGNLIVGVMFALLTYYLAYFGQVSPDRVVRVRLFKFMARVPMTATLTLLAYVTVGRASPLLGLPPETMQAIAIVTTVMLIEWAIHRYKRPLERLMQLNVEPEVRRIQELSERIFTTRDLHQFLESILTATCDALRTPTAFVAAISPDGPRLEVVVGPLTDADTLWQPGKWQELGQNGDSDLPPDLHTSQSFVLWERYWIRPLYNRSADTMLGIMGILGRSPEPDLSQVEQDVFERLARQAAGALEDRRLQREVFGAVEGLLPGITARQLRRSAATYGTAAQMTQSLTMESPSLDLVEDPEFTKMVRDALSHFWGGPKLTDSPLMRLRVVQEAMRANENNATRALRATLQQAIELQRPIGERRMTTAEWILYNILELKFVQGQKVRDIARRLAMSESDLYRKQRVAIENVAQALSRMEEAAIFGDEDEPEEEDTIEVAG